MLYIYITFVNDRVLKKIKNFVTFFILITSNIYKTFLKTLLEKRTAAGGARTLKGTRKKLARKVPPNGGNKTMSNSAVNCRLGVT